MDCTLLRVSQQQEGIPQEITCLAQGGSSLCPEAVSEDIKKAQKQSSGNASFPASRQWDWKWPLSTGGSATSQNQELLRKADDAFFSLKSLGTGTHVNFS